MQSRGVMQQLRELLAQGKSSGQLIGMGYAPGSVYKAQRQVRRRQGVIVVPEAKTQPPAAPAASVELLKVMELQAQLQRSEENREGLLQALAELQREAARTAERLQKLGQERDTLRALLAQAEARAAGRVAEARADPSRMQGELDRVTREKLRLEEFMTDTDPTWRLGFGCWTRERTGHSPDHEPICSFGQPRARAGPVCTYNEKDGLQQRCSPRTGCG